MPYQRLKTNDPKRYAAAGTACAFCGHDTVVYWIVRYQTTAPWEECSRSAACWLCGSSARVRSQGHEIESIPIMPRCMGCGVDLPMGRGALSRCETCSRLYHHRGKSHRMREGDPFGPPDWYVTKGG